MAATSSRVIAAFSPPGRGGQREGRFSVYTSPASGGGWRLVPAATGHGSPSLFTGGSTGYVITQDGPSGSTLLSGPVNGTARWQRRPLPCDDWPAAAASPGGEIAVACALLGSHPTPTSEHLSTDGGWTWRRLTSPLLDDGADTISLAPGGRPIVLSGAYSGLLISWNNGLTWRSVPAVDHLPVVGGGGTIAAAMITRDDGYAIVDRSQLWVTRDAGHSWSPVTIH